MFFRCGLAENNRNLSRYAQILWVTLCINCYIQRLPAVFITVLLDCTKTRQPDSCYNYQ